MIKKILYGIQGTGNGHTERSRIIAKELQNHPNIHVDYLFSGRPKEEYSEMDIFDDFQCKKGLTFSISNGKVNLLKTILHADIKQFINDVKSINISQYDLIISDYEPITAWAAKLNNIPSIGISHQAAFYYDIPSNMDIFSKWFMHNFAPTTNNIGLHWHHFNQNILPPIINTNLQSTGNKDILVYLPNENQIDIAHILEQVSIKTGKVFNVFTPNPPCANYSNVIFHKTSHKIFKQYLQNCEAVICNTGFELISEALHLNKPILTKPVHKQVEQLANAEALVQLKYATVVHNITYIDTLQWINNYSTVNVNFPNTAKYVVDAIVNNTTINYKDLW